jgi:hypothetical protein
LIVIPASIELIHDTSFARFANLVTVEFAAGSCIQRIFGFRFCPQLRMASLPADGQLCELGGFCGCHALQQIVIPASVVMVANPVSPSPFHACRALTEVAFAENPGLRELYGFDMRVRLAVIRVPCSVEIIRGFCDCYSLTDVAFGDSNRVREIQGFSGCSALRRVELPPSVELISAFGDCRSLVELVLPPGGRLREIQGFIACRSLE